MRVCEKQNGLQLLLHSNVGRPLVAFLFILPSLWGQAEDPKRFLAVKKWTGSFTVSTVFSGSSTLATWNVSELSSGTIVFTPEPNVPGSWIGTVTAKISWNDDFSVTDPGPPPCKISWSRHDNSTQTSVGHLRLSGATFASFSDASEIVGDLVTTLTGDCLPIGQSVGVMQAYLEGNFTAPSTGLHVQGSQTHPYVPYSAVLVLSPATTVVTWDFTGDAADVELIITADGYDTWRPQAGGDEKTPGNTLTFTGKLQNKDGSVPTARVKKFTYELNDADRSRVPGIVMNYPPKSDSPPDPDLKIDKNINPGLSVPSSDKAESPDGAYITSPPITVSSYDWGAYGALTITAMLTDGSTVVGHLKDDSSQTKVRIPKRLINSHIADSWKADHHVTGKPDTDDSELDPVGDGHPGDGLTLYEEYRGFYENGKRIEGDPAKKNLFVCDMSGQREGAAALYAQLTRIVVHARLRSDELLSEKNAVINFNAEAGFNHNPQHALILKDEPELQGYAYTHRVGAGTPKTVSFIGIPRQQLDDKGARLEKNGKPTKAREDYISGITVHEMLHGSNVEHHGTGEDLLLFWSNPRMPNPYYEIWVDETYLSDFSVPALAFLETHERLPNIPPGLSNWLAGAYAGLDSGVEGCVMRYDTAEVYPISTPVSIDDRKRAIVFPQQPYRNNPPVLCDTGVGSGINDPSNKYSFGDAPRGNCKAQLCINDRYDHTR